MHELSRPLRAEEELQVQVRLMQMLQKKSGTVYLRKGHISPRGHCQGPAGVHPVLPGAVFC